MTAAPIGAAQGVGMNYREIAAGVAFTFCIAVIYGACFIVAPALLP